MNTSEHIGPKLKSISNLIKQRLCKDGQGINLTSAQMHVLKYLCTHQDDAIYQKDILNEFDLSNATVSGIISRLEAKGFVTCAHSCSDSRCKQINLTQKALDHHISIQENIKRLDALIESGFTEEELSMLHDYLNRIFDNLNS